MSAFLNTINDIFGAAQKGADVYATVVGNPRTASTPTFAQVVPSYESQNTSTPPAPTPSPGLGLGAKVAIGVGAAGLITTIIVLATRKKKRK